MKPPVLIFLQSKQRAKELYHELQYDDINVDVIHADRTPAQVTTFRLDMEVHRLACHTPVEFLLACLLLACLLLDAQRSEAVRRFRTGETWVLIATDLMCRGVDFKAVNMVINYDFPQVTIASRRVVLRVLTMSAWHGCTGRHCRVWSATSIASGAQGVLGGRARL